MDITELQQFYSKTYSLGYLGVDINTKFALISLLGYLTYKIKQKKPSVTSYQIIKQISKNKFPEKFVKGLSVVVDDFSYGCKEFSTFGIEDKKIPQQISGILSTYTPF